MVSNPRLGLEQEATIVLTMVVVEEVAKVVALLGVAAKLVEVAVVAWLAVVFMILVL